MKSLFGLGQQNTVVVTSMFRNVTMLIWERIEKMWGKQRIGKEEPNLEMGACGKEHMGNSLWHMVRYLLRKGISKSQI